MSRRERRSTSFPNREAIPVDSRGWRRFAATPGQNARTRMNPSGVSDHKRRSSPPFMNHPTPPKPALRANRQVAQGAARLCGRALGTRTPIRATGHAPINAIPNRVAIPERSRGWRRFAATPGHDAKTRMNPDGVPVHNRRFASPPMNHPTPPKPAAGEPAGSPGRCPALRASPGYTNADPRHRPRANQRHLQSRSDSRT
jgi:hypothetical protein